MMTRQSLFRVLFLTVIISVFLPGGACATTETPQQIPGYDQIALQAEAGLAAAEAQILAGAAEVEALLRSSKTETSEMTGAWNTILEQRFRSPAVKDLTVLRSLLAVALQRGIAQKAAEARGAAAPAGEGRITLAIARDIHDDAKELLEFANEIQSVGEAIEWTLKVNRHIKSLEFDIENAPVRVDVYVKEMRQTSVALVTTIAMVRRGVELRRSGSATPASIASLRNEVAQALRSVATMKNKTQSAALSLLNTAAYLQPGEGYVVPASEARRINVLAEYWRDARNLYPRVKREILEGVARWAPLPKAKWEAYGETRKKFVEAYGPLLAGDIFKGVPLFDGKKYNELTGVVAEVENTLRALLANIDDLRRDMDERMKALQQDEILTQRERAQLMTIMQQFSPERARNLVIAATRAGGGPNRVLELERLKNGVASGSEEFRKYDAEQKLLQSRQHPEQIKADAALRDFYRDVGTARRTMEDILKQHVARRTALGLPSALREATLAKAQ